ncbi:hypothetical protein LTR94_028831, partial [Friedmanniomyces endolithicus]
DSDRKQQYDAGEDSCEIHELLLIADYALAPSSATETDLRRAKSSIHDSAVSRQSLSNIRFKIAIEEVVRTRFTAVRPVSALAEGFQIGPGMSEKSIAALGFNLPCKQGRTRAPFEASRIGRPPVQPCRNLLLAKAAGDWIDANRRTIRQIDQSAGLIPHDRAAHAATRGRIVVIADLRPGHDTVDHLTIGAWRNVGREVGLSNNGVHEIGDDQAVAHLRIACDPLSDQSIKQICSLLDAGEHDRTLWMATQPNLKGGGDIAIGECPRLSGVIP